MRHIRPPKIDLTDTDDDVIVRGAQLAPILLVLTEISMEAK